MWNMRHGIGYIILWNFHFTSVMFIALAIYLILSIGIFQCVFSKKKTVYFRRSAFVESHCKVMCTALAIYLILSIGIFRCVFNKKFI